MATRADRRRSRREVSDLAVARLWRRGLRLASVSRGGAGKGADPPPWRLLGALGGLMPVAAVMRLWDLGARAMHHDESLHALYSWYLYTGAGFRHEPMMHGPFQMEATAASFFAFGDSDFSARLVYAVAGVALVGLPYFFRARLGNLGAVFVAVMLAFSPTMLYFSRFARNDILMAVWALGLVICMWRYIDEGRNRYLYIGAGLLALAFATKETAYIFTATLGLFLVLALVVRNWSTITRGVTVGRVSPPVAVYRVVTGAASVAMGGLSAGRVSRSAGFLVLLSTLTLPLWAALASMLQDTPLLGWSNLVLAGPVGGQGPIGAPYGGGGYIAALIVLALLWISAEVGFRWSRSVWWRCAVIFVVVWVLLYSTFFTNMGGVLSGVWQSLGYWVVQQEVARGSQPLYYYLVITPLYEFLPLALAVAGGVYYVRRRDPFGLFLAFWAGTTFILYTAAAEKMPWLLVNVTLPLIVLAGKFLADLVNGIRWARLASGGGLYLLPGVPLLVLLLWRLAFFDAGEWELSDVLALLAGVVALVVVGALGVRLARRMGYRDFAAFATLPLVGILLVLSVRAGWYVSYRNGDNPVEMLVYTQTSPDIVGVLRSMEELGAASGDPTQVPVTIDGTSGFTWPWAWYLRDYSRVGYPSYDQSPLQEVPDSSVVLIHSRNQKEADPILADVYAGGTRIKHRWWFPEIYRGLTVGKFLGAMVDRRAWRRTMDYFLYRRLGSPLGSEDAYVYFSQEFPATFTPQP